MSIFLNPTEGRVAESELLCLLKTFNHQKEHSHLVDFIIYLIMHNNFVQSMVIITANINNLL